MVVLVAGSTGFLGGEICRRLRARGVTARGLVRRTSNPSMVDQQRSVGVETVVGDVRDRTSLDAACVGVDAVVSTVTTTRSRAEGDSLEASDHAGQLSLVDAARVAGVRRFLFVSFSGGIGGADALTTAKRDVEHRIRESGMTYTILRPTYFQEVWLGPHLGFDAANAKARVYGSGENPISFISLGDVAEFAVRSVDAPAAEDTVLELGGPEALTPHEVIRIFEEEGGRPFQIEYVPESALEAAAANANDSLQRTFAVLSLCYARGDAVRMEETLRRFPIALRTVREYARDVLAQA